MAANGEPVGQKHLSSAKCKTLPLKDLHQGLMRSGLWFYKDSPRREWKDSREEAVKKLLGGWGVGMTAVVTCTKVGCQ